MAQTMLPGAVEEAETNANPSRPERLVAWVEGLVFDRPLRQLVMAIVLLDFVKNGLWTAPEIDQWSAMARSFPSRPGLDPQYRFILSSPIGPAIAHLTHLATPGEYALLSFGFVVVAVGIIVAGLYHRAGRVGAGLGLVALFASPLSNVLVTWLGKEDPFLLMGTAAVVLFDGWLPLMIGSLILAAANPEAGAIVLVIVLALRISRSGHNTGELMALLGGFGAGFGLLAAYDAHIGGGLDARVSYVRASGVGSLVRQFLSEWPTWTFTVFGAWWLPTVAWWSRIFRNRSKIPFAGGLLLAAAASVASVDQTRIAALVSLPLGLWFAAEAARLVPTTSMRRLAALTFLAAAVLPRLIVEEGSTYVSHLNFLLPRSLG